MRSRSPSTTYPGRCRRAGSASPTGRCGAAAATEAANQDLLSIGDVDRTVAAIDGMRGSGSAVRRAAALRTLFSRATPAEQEFLLRLIAGELRQGALVGVMLEAIAAGRRRAAGGGAPGGHVLEEPGSGGACRDTGRSGVSKRDSSSSCSCPRHPCSRRRRTDVAEALRALGGEAGVEWKMDGARIQVHKASDEVRVYTRALNEVTGAVPEIVEAVRTFGAPDAGARWRSNHVRFRGAAASLSDHHAPLRPQAQRRIDAHRAAIRGIFFFDCLHFDGPQHRGPAHTRTRRCAGPGRPGAAACS